jgi:hypothetical protein
LSGSGGGQPYAGQTAGDYAELIMCTNSKIESTGSIVCTGYITEELKESQTSKTGNKMLA